MTGRDKAECPYWHSVTYPDKALAWRVLQNDLKRIEERKPENGILVVEDSKGVKTPVYKLKRKLMKFRHGITVRET